MGIPSERNVFLLSTNNTSIPLPCHKLVVVSASSNIRQWCEANPKTSVIDVTPLTEHILRTVVAFMYNSDYSINDKNVIELLSLSNDWNFRTLAKLCVDYMNDNITIDNACRFYNCIIVYEKQL